MFYVNRRGSSILTGLHYFKQAIELDHDYALAYAGYAYANLIAAFYSFFSGKEVKNEIKISAERAIKLDNLLAEPYCTLSSYYPYLERNWAEGIKSARKAIQLNPSYAQAYSWYGMIYLGWLEGRFDEAAQQGHIAIGLEPLSAIDHADLAWTLLTAGKPEEALTIAKTGIELDANSFLSHRLAGLSYIALERYEEATDTFKYLLKISNRHQHAVNSLIWAYCSNGNLKEANELMNELKGRSTTEYIAGTYAGLSAAYLGEIDDAFDYLEKAYNDYDPILIQLKYAPYVPTLLRNDLRFQHLLDRIYFPE